MMNKLTLMASFAVLCSFSAMAGDIEETRSLSHLINDAKTIRLDVGAGSLEVVGVEGVSEVTVTAHLDVNEGEFELTLQEKGGVLELFSRTDSNDSFWSDSTKIDLVVRVPNNVELHVIDSSGSATIDNIGANVNVKDGSGALTVSNIRGEVVIDDGSGECQVNDVTGNLIVDDGSGSLTISNIDGTVKVDDGSGSLSISMVSGMVEIDDGSGSIHLVDLQAGVDIIDAGSGGLTMTRVKGKNDN